MKRYVKMQMTLSSKSHSFCYKKSIKLKIRNGSNKLHDITQDTGKQSKKLIQTFNFIRTIISTHSFQHVI